MRKTAACTLLTIGLTAPLLVTGCREESGELTGPATGAALSETSESFFQLTGTTLEELAALEALAKQEGVTVSATASSVPAGAIVLDFEDLTDSVPPYGFHTMAAHNPYLGLTFSADGQGTPGIYHWNRVSYGNPHSGQVFVYNVGGLDSEHITIQQPVIFHGAWVGKPATHTYYSEEFWFEGYDGTAKVGESAHITLTPTMQWVPAAFEGPVDRVVFRRSCDSSYGCWWVMDDIAFTPPGSPVTRTPWEMNNGGGIVLFEIASPDHGHPMEYDYATIPSPDDPGWDPAPDPEVIDYQQVPSTLCGVCECRYGGDFTYFRTLVDVPANAWLTEFKISTSGVDDGIRVSIYNSEYPDGLVVPGSYVYRLGSGTADLQDYVVSGEVNTVIITHVDDCCYDSFLLTAQVVLSGMVVPTGPATVPPVADAGGAYVGEEGAPVMFDGSGSIDSDGSIVSFDWDFGDGNTGSGPTAQHTYADDGVYTVTLTVTDDDGQSSSASATATIANVAPALSVDLNSVAVSEGDLAANAGTVSDPGEDQVTLTASVGELTRAGAAWSWSFTAIDGPAQSQTVTVTAVDDDGGVNETSFELVVDNVAPTVGAITATLNPVSVGTPITASAGFSDPGTLDTHTAAWIWDWPAKISGAGTVTQGAGSGAVTDSHAYTEAGLYEIQLAVTDSDGDSGQSPVFEYVVVYDPTAGFVTGGGWINSPAGAYKPDPSLTGRANFGFVAKYKQGTKVPAGQAEFQFHLAGLDFHSTSHEWLIVTGSDYARFKGSGTINGTGVYKFMIWAGDKDADTFRIKIWEEDEATGVETDVYDNGFDQEIGGGSIVIHPQ